MSPCCENKELEVEPLNGEVSKRELVCQGCGCIWGPEGGIVENEEAEEDEGEVMQ